MMRTIISVHPDDELLACMSVMNDSNIVQMFGTDSRYAEFLNLIQEFKGVTPYVCNDLSSIIALCEDSYEIFLPSPMDLNIEHKWISKLITHLASHKAFNFKATLFFYSYNGLFPVECDNQTDIKWEVDLKRKKSLLKKYYPSQYDDLEKCGIVKGLKNTETFKRWNQK